MSDVLDWWHLVKESPLLHVKWHCDSDTRRCDGECNDTVNYKRTKSWETNTRRGTFCSFFLWHHRSQKLSTPSLSHRCRISSKNTRKLHMCPLEGEKVHELISLLSVFGRCKATLRPLIRRKKCIVSYQQQSALFLFHGIRLPYRQQLPCSTQLNPRGPNFRSLTRKK